MIPTPDTKATTFDKTLGAVEQWGNLLAQAVHWLEMPRMHQTQPAKSLVRRIETGEPSAHLSRLILMVSFHVVQQTGYTHLELVHHLLDGYETLHLLLQMPRLLQARGQNDFAALKRIAVPPHRWDYLLLAHLDESRWNSDAMAMKSLFKDDQWLMQWRERMLNAAGVGEGTSYEI